MAEGPMTVSIAFIALCYVVFGALDAACQNRQMHRASRIVHVDSCAQAVIASHPWSFRSGDTIAMYQSISQDSLINGGIEVNVIDTIIGAEIILRYPIEDRFDPSGHLQLVGVIHRSSVASNDRLRAIPWNGEYGGLMVLLSDDTLSIDGLISATQAGFRGGRQNRNSGDTIDARSATYTEGFLPTPNGHLRNSGGYGGSLAGHGGRGGDPTTAFSLDEHQAIPRAWPVSGRDTSRLRIYIGSGGGAGQQNDLRGGNGGAGGGAIVVSAPVIRVGTGGAIDVSGTDGDDALCDGAGGGGSGGTIALITDTIVGTMHCDVSGGVGGSTRGTVYWYGPGGGGAGGLVYTSSSSLLPSIRVQRGGGASGGSQVDTSAERTPHGAEPGSDGSIRTTRHKLIHSRTPRPGIVLTRRDTLVDGRAHYIITPTAGVVRAWYVDGTERTGTPTLLIATDSNIERIEADVYNGLCVTRRAMDLPVKPQQTEDLLIAADNLRVSIGDTVSVFIRIERGAGRSAISGTIVVRLYQPVLMPVLTRYRTIDRYTVLEIPFTLPRDTRSTFRRFDIVALLGDSSSVQISFDTAMVTPSATRVRRQPGRVTIDDICVTDRTRLFDATSMFQRRGRDVRIRADDGFITNVIGEILTRMTRDGNSGWIVGSIPEQHRGPCFLVAQRGTRILTHQFLISE